jgi:hypothetical protein
MTVHFETDGAVATVTIDQAFGGFMPPPIPGPSN